jgi:methyl-accepting chemotaxis protein
MKKKVIIALCFIFFFFIVGSTITILSVTDTTEELNQIIKLHQVEQLRRALVISLQNVQANIYTIHTPLAQDLNLIVNNVLNLEETSNKCTTCHHPPQIFSRIVKVQSLIKDYEEHLSYYITSSADSKRIEKLKLQAVQKGNEILSDVASMSHSATKNLEELTKTTTDNIKKIKNTLLITIGLTIFIGFIIAAKLTKTVTYPVKKILEATKGIASGKLGTTVSYNDKTEFGELAQNFNIMSSELKKRNEALIKKDGELEKKSIELQRRVNELEEFYEMSVGRELRMQELKNKIEKQKSQIKKLES